MSSYDKDLLNLIISMRECLPHRERRKDLQVYIRTLPKEVLQDILNRREQINEAWREWKESNYTILLRLGFNDIEADFLRDKRLDSPGMRRVILNRAVELKMAKPEVLVD
jgi:hypothetical protein